MPIRTQLASDYGAGRHDLDPTIGSYRDVSNGPDPPSVSQKRTVEYILFIIWLVAMLYLIYALGTGPSQCGNMLMACYAPMANTPGSASPTVSLVSGLFALNNSLTHIRPIGWLLLLLALGRYITGLWTSALIRNVISRVQYRLDVPSPQPFGYEAEQDPYWDQWAENAIASWSCESIGKNMAMRRTEGYSHLFGFVGSIALIGALVSVRASEDPSMGALQSIAMTVGVATAVSFALEMAVVLIRIANLDVSARMFAAAIRTMLAVIVAAFAFPAIATKIGDASLKNLVGSGLGQLLLGTAIALLGRQALGIITTRARTLLGAPAAAPDGENDLKKILGMNPDDIDRLAEEGIDSINALAYASVPKLFFNTVYPLHRICEWQDQALLYDLAGAPLAGAFQSNFQIRGVLDAQPIVKLLLGAPVGSSGQGPTLHPVPEGAANQPADTPPARPSSVTAEQAQSAPAPEGAAEQAAGVSAPPEEDVAEQHPSSLPPSRPARVPAVVNSAKRDSPAILRDGALPPIRIEAPTDCFKLLGLNGVDQARIVLGTIAANPRIGELRVFWESSVIKRDLDNINVSDPNQGKFGGTAVRNHCELSAKIERTDIPGVCDLTFTVRSNDPTQFPLSGKVTFYLHPTYSPQSQTVPVTDGVATLTTKSWGVFTVGTVVQRGWRRTKLELDLAYVPGGDELFYAR